MPLPSPAFTHSHFSESFQNLDGVRAGANTSKMRPLARGAEGSVEVMSVSSYSDHLDSSTSHQLTNQFSSVQFIQLSRSVVSDSSRPHESQHARPPCPSPTPGAYSNSCPSSWWCYSAISSSVVPFNRALLPPIPPSIRVFSNESTLHMRWPKYWSFRFSISPSNN